MFISVHIPKTAGTTFRELLAASFGESLCLFYAGLKNWQMEPIPEIPAHARCLHGHIHARDYDHCFPEVRRLTWLRDPVERVASEFQHHRRHGDPANPLAVHIARGGTLLEFARQPEARNTQSRVLQGLRAADFTFAGISEHFDRELERLADITGIRLPPGHRANVNPARLTPRYTLLPAERAAITELNDGDVALYREALAIAGLAG